ncbi:MAG TPA: 7-carboxy-7-deazaguanine synthase QueE [Chromatiaceae bacterium]|nr:7-carboxy-7-deazaguanine synthase QueE [Chromatiaceae bacterium]
MPGIELRITEIFRSLQGEGRSIGLPTVFVRLTGCPLRCGYCDTRYAFKGGRLLSLDAVLEKVGSFDTRHVVVTGGEPLAQPSCIPLLDRLLERNYEISLETSGALDISPVDTRVSRVMDLKTPASGEQARNRLENLALLTPHDQLKFVICDRRDYDWAKQMLDTHALHGRCELLFSPAFGQLDGAELAEWILEDGLSVRFQLQLHKVLWGDEPGR